MAFPTVPTSVGKGIIVPKGKILTILKGGKTPIPKGANCILEEDITLSLSSTFAPLLSGGMPNIAKLLAGVIGGVFDKDIPVGFKQFGYQIWQNTDPLSFSASIGFYMDTNAKIDVYDPMMELIALPLPTEIGNKGGLKAPGPTVFSLITQKGLQSTSADKEKTLDIGETKNKWDVSKGDRLSLQIGKLIYLHNIIVKKAEPTVSIETDELGYPMWGKIMLDISTVEIATTNMIKRRF